MEVEEYAYDTTLVTGIGYHACRWSGALSPLDYVRYGRVFCTAAVDTECGLFSKKGWVPPTLLQYLVRTYQARTIYSTAAVPGYRMILDS